MDDRVFSLSLHNFLVTLVLVVGLMAGCALVPHSSGSQANALLLPSSNLDAMWERAVTVLHRNHFVIARESKLEGTIETEYRAGSSLLELWHPDSVGHDNRRESTVQSIRRKVTITFRQSGSGQVMMAVFVHKEIEDVPGPTATYEGGATFSESNVFNRDLDQVVGQASPSRWLPRGRDSLLEGRLVAQIRGTDR
jgi:hypothetical protein